MRYIPAWEEIAITAAVIAAELVVLRWIVNRMPILSDPPAWAREEENHKPSRKHFVKTEEPEEWKVSGM
jgi:Ni/Fe-hydrogenase subunit HybB-like protein